VANRANRASSLSVSLAVHALAIAAIMFVFRAKADHVQHAEPSRVRAIQLAWIPDPRPASRGGGQPKQAPTRVVERPVTATPPPVVTIEPPTIAPEPDPRVVAEAAPPTPAVPENGPDQPGGLGNGNGPGPGSGPDKGPGSGDDGVFAVGNGVTSPIPIKRAQPAYTADAMRRRLQGVVVLNCVVRADGTCSDIRIVQSLDMVYGLDQQAVASAREWRFRPGTRLGEPVPVQVTLEIAFSIR
jgi:periplasmic protein TonB